MATQTYRSRKTKKRPAGIIVGCVVAIVVVAAILQLAHVTHWFGKPTATKGAPYEPAPNHTGPAASAGQSSGSNNAGKHSDNTSPIPAPSTNPSIVLETPNGTFVSSHHVTLDSPIESVCNTTSGATCTITFTKDGVSKSLSTENTDKNGSVYWSWQPSQIGLTAGSWHIAAQAAYGDQTKTASDALTLEVSP
ncbi:MAG TPA: hypothetical protein VKQ34_03440 [Candidatus Saccharimonadales bacterium]|nr:hypothetical protein [Candidatus Saccharimonadales bacterium]